MPASQAPPPQPDVTPRRTLAIGTGEFLWLTFAVWIGGIFILTLMPYLLMPRLGGPLAIAGSYFLFFVGWQPIQVITQRTLGTKAAVIRMILFVASAATIASYLRQALPTLTSVS
jgi:uncharacterized membrane protein